MEEDVKVLMSVADEALCNSVGLFSSNDNLSRCTNYSSSLPFSATLSSNSEPTTSLLYSQSTSSFSPTNTTPHKSNTPTVTSSLPLPFRSLPKTSGPTIHACNISPYFSSAFTHNLTHPATCRDSPLAPRSYQAYLTSREHINHTGTLQKPRPHLTGGKKPSTRPWVPKKTKKKLVVGFDIGFLEANKYLKQSSMKPE
jgi:hypothetical protein